MGDGSVVSSLAIGAGGPRFEPRFSLNAHVYPAANGYLAKSWAVKTARKRFGHPPLMPCRPM